MWLVILAVIAAPVTLTAQALGRSLVAAAVMVLWVVLVLCWISERPGPGSTTPARLTLLSTAPLDQGQ